MQKLVTCLYLMFLAFTMQASSDVSIKDDYHQTLLHVSSVLHRLKFTDDTQDFLIRVSGMDYNYNVVYTGCVCSFRVNCIEEDHKRLVLLDYKNYNVEGITRVITADIQTQKLAKSGYFK